MASEKDVLDTSTGKPLVAADQNGQNAVEDFVDPWNVHTSSMKGVDYDKLISKLILILNVFFKCNNCPIRNALSWNGKDYQPLP